jgi:hypothetical protein
MMNRILEGLNMVSPSTTLFDMLAMCISMHYWREDQQLHEGKPHKAAKSNCLATATTFNKRSLFIKYKFLIIYFSPQS